MSDVPPVPARPAASLILMRQAVGLEVLVGRRAADARAFPSATVFPGGKIEPQDHDRARDGLDAARHAALRETFEETALFIAADGQGAPPHADVAGERLAVELGQRRLFELEALWGRRLGLSRLIPFAHWITPERAPYRFDTLFFLAEASASEAAASLICAEFDTLGWARPADVLREEAARLVSPTRHCLEALSACASPAEAAGAALARGMIDGAAVRAGRRAGPQPLAAR